MTFKEDFLKSHPTPIKPSRRSIPDHLIKDCVDLNKMGFSVKTIAAHAGVGYDALLRATRQHRLKDETPK
jgi:hypothetical protein